MLDLGNLIQQTNVETRQYQQRIVEKVFSCLTEKKMRSVLVESATGSGKTILALLLVKALQDEFNIRVGWVAMRRHLLAQVKEENMSKGFNIPLTYISMFDKEIPGPLDMLVVDEAQHDVTDSMSHIHTVTNPKWILGLSATPFRADRVKLCFDSVIKDAGIAALIKDGYLSSYHHYFIPKWGPDEVTGYYIAEPDRWGSSIMYFHRQVQCQQAADRLRTAGIACDVVTGSSDVDQQIEDFSAGKLSVLINCMKLTEGINLPELKTVFVRPSCKPVTIQMAGRVLRKHPNVPVKQIVQNEKTPYPFTKLAIAELQHVRLDDTWRTLQVNPHIDSITKRTMAATIKTEIEIPKFITKHTQRAAPIGRRNTRDNFPGGLGPVQQMNDEAHEGEIERDRGTIEMDSTLAFEASINNRVEGGR